MANPGADPLDVDLTDRDLLSEVELLVGLMEAGSRSPGPLGREALDALLFGEPENLAPDGSPTR